MEQGSNIQVRPEGAIHNAAVRRVVRLLGRVEYRRFPISWEVQLTPFGEVTFRLIARVNNADGTGPIELINGTRALPQGAAEELVSDEFIFGIVYGSIRAFEMHELDEHFYLDGVKVYDPHVSGKE